MKPIGLVKTQAKGNEVKEKTRLSQIIINHKLTEALEGIAGFSHLYVLFWLDRTSYEERKTLRVHPRGREGLPLVGVFAARTKLRPNPIGLTLVQLVRIDDNVLTVRGLDAFDGTPVLDLKPIDFWDTAKNTRMPDWWSKLEEEK